MPGLVLEGGTFRPIFSAGVMDAMLEHNILFPIVLVCQRELPMDFLMCLSKKGAIWKFCGNTVMINAMLAPETF